jgi:hypothetical protein
MRLRLRIIDSAVLLSVSILFELAVFLLRRLRRNEKC